MIANRNESNTAAGKNGDTGRGSRWIHAGDYVVLILLVEKKDGLHLLFEKRAETIKQPGDICFPGDVSGSGRTLEECALRKRWKKTGLHEIQILGKVCDAV